MNQLFVIALLAGALYLSYQQQLFDGLRDLGGNGAMEKPVYGRMTVDIRAEVRDLLKHRLGYVPGRPNLRAGT